ncbi:MAG: hydrolase [Bdellovibrionaceae bacterium]|nr:hydrolase [Bdellovibrionales bacterium]MCB9082810.1 hydrolase [Pseudobdellovibrionaceae bacterium]
MGRDKTQTAVLVILVLLTPHRLNPNHKNRWILWNVGQGQWFTYSTPTVCHHLDMGGEFVSWQKVRMECGGKSNQLHISHWDWDHLSFLRKATALLPHLCLIQPPQGPRPVSLTKLTSVNSIPPCAVNSATKVWRELKWTIRTGTRASANDYSRVMISRHQVLLPGDSTTPQERRWARRLSGRESRNIKLLVLGHHGSKTSTSDELLDRIPFLQSAWVSARKRRYGHPHSTVVKRLRDRKIPLLRTEDWGNLILVDGNPVSVQSGSR